MFLEATYDSVLIVRPTTLPPSDSCVFLTPPRYRNQFQSGHNYRQTTRQDPRQWHEAKGRRNRCGRPKFLQDATRVAVTARNLAHIANIHGMLERCRAMSIGEIFLQMSPDHL